MGSKTIFCGDGINDLPALAAATVGISVGATDAVIAAAVSTPQGSVAGNHSHAVKAPNPWPCLKLAFQVDAWIVTSHISPSNYLL